MSRPAPINITRSSPRPFDSPSRDFSRQKPREDSAAPDRQDPRSPTTSNILVSSPSQPGGEDHCTCPPQPPRPENCFILFRSAHQKQLSESGGNNQPEISVKVGDLWKKADPAVKEYWKAEAEKRKASHKQLYPNYKYQPKSKARASGPTHDKICNVCSKRLTGIQPGSPHSNTSPRFPDRALDAPVSPFSPQTSPTFKPQSHSSPQSPIMIGIQPAMPPGRRESLSGPSHATTAANRNKRLSDPDLLPHSRNSNSLDSKRRRMSQVGVPRSPVRTNTPPHAGQFARQSNSGHHGPPPAMYNRRPPLDVAASQAPTHSVRGPPPNMSQWTANKSNPPLSARTMAPPAPHTPNQGPPTPRHLPGIAEVMRSPLPPPTSMPPPMRRSISGDDGGVRLAPLNTGQGADPRSGETIATSRPFTDKIERLSRVSRPVKMTHPGSPGILIAVEGDDWEASQSLARLLESTLMKEEGHFKTKLDTGPIDQNTRSKDLTLKDYVEVIGRWHDKSQEIAEYLMPQEETAEEDKTRSPSKRTSPIPRVPVLIVPNFQVRITDMYASRIPITDNYSPDLHYEHMVSLWRGIVGPDLTIYLRDVPREQLSKEVVHIIHKTSIMRIAKERGSRKVDEERIRAMRYQVGAFIRKAGPAQEVDLTSGGENGMIQL